MTKTTHPLLDLRQGRVDDALQRTPNIPLPYIVELETQTLGPISLIQCGLTGEIFATQLDGFQISLTEMKHAGYRPQAEYLTGQFVYRGTLQRIEMLKAEITKLERNLKTYAAAATGEPVL